MSSQHTPPTRTLTRLRGLAAWALGLWLLALGVAVAAPLMEPLHGPTCHAAAADDQAPGPDGRVHCAACLPLLAPPSPWQPTPAPNPPPQTRPEPVLAACAPATPAWQPPLRGPPTLS
ncbi:MAG: hypothetical protein U1E77_21205 [Inhella sp.]